MPIHRRIVAVKADIPRSGLADQYSGQVVGSIPILRSQLALNGVCCGRQRLSGGDATRGEWQNDEEAK